MGLRLPTLMMIGAASVTGAAATYFAPILLQDGGQSALASTESAQPATPARMAASAPVQPIFGDGASGCNARAWPYISKDCAAKQAALRQVRIISTDRDAPRLVPLPASMRVATLDAASADKAVTADIATAPADGVAVMAMLPPARPAELAAATSDANGTAQAGEIDATGSLVPADGKLTAKATRQRIARARERDYGRVRAAYAGAQPGDDLAMSARAGVYRYSDGREVIVRPEYDAQPRRVVAERDSERRQPAGLLGALFGSF